MFQTSLMGRTVVFSNDADDHLKGKSGPIVSAYMDGNGQIRFHVEIDGAVYLALITAGVNAPCKLLPKDK